MASSARSSLIVHLAGGYLLLIVYASLYPLAGWHDSGGDPLAFLAAAWPRYVTWFDLASNVLGYLPLGFLVAAALRRWLAPFPAWLAAAVLGAGISFTMELLQNYLPSRVPSHLDLVCNAAGALIGALAGAYRGPRLLDESRLARWRRQALARSPGVEAGVLLMMAWLMTQLSPETLLFGSGNLRRMLDLPSAQPFQPERFLLFEAAIAAAGLLAAGLIASLLLRPEARRLAVALLPAALLMKSFAHAVLIAPAAAFGWLTPGSGAGLCLGLVVWRGASLLGPAGQRAVAASALLFASVMVNLAPENPYLLNALNAWNPAQFLNFNGLTRLLSSLWPFLAMPWLMIYRPDRNHDHDH